MSRVIFKKNRTKHASISSPSISSNISSASELSYLKAQVWSLLNHLREEKVSTKNLSESFKKLANEKYELLEELTRRNISMKEFQEELDQEREINDIFMNENEALHEEIDKHRALLEKAVIQNVNLKQRIIDANERISQLGHMCLKFKERAL